VVTRPSRYNERFPALEEVTLPSNMPQVSEPSLVVRSDILDSNFMSLERKREIFAWSFAVSPCYHQLTSEPFPNHIDLSEGLIRTFPHQRCNSSGSSLSTSRTSNVAVQDFPSTEVSLHKRKTLAALTQDCDSSDIAKATKVMRTTRSTCNMKPIFYGGLVEVSD